MPTAPEMRYTNLMKRRPQPASPTERQALYQVLLALKTPAECEAFLTDLLTPAELAALADRWRCAQALAVGETYREVAARTGISLTTVTRVARALFGGTGGYKTLLQRLKFKTTAL